MKEGEPRSCREEKDDRGCLGYEGVECIRNCRMITVEAEGGIADEAWKKRPEIAEKD